MDFIKLIHISMASISISGFIIRGIWMMNNSVQLQKKWVKVLPHIIDTLLLLSALILAVGYSVNPLEQVWLLAKIIALVLYIALGMIALRFGKSLFQRKIAWILAILVFSYIVMVAITKQTFPY